MSDKITVREFINQNPGLNFQFLTKNGYTDIDAKDVPVILADPKMTLYAKSGNNHAPMESTYLLDELYIYSSGLPTRKTGNRMVIHAIAGT